MTTVDLMGSSAKSRAVNLLFISAAEPSGDLFAAGLVQQLRQLNPELQFIGITGPAMKAAGVETLADIEELSVMGLTEVLKHLPRLLKLRKKIIAKMLELNPGAFIGIDAPDFNLKIAKTAKQHGIYSILYNSPTVWAWRPGRVKSIAASLDLLLCQFPFEPKYYQCTHLTAIFIGHPLADQIPLQKNASAAKQQLQITETTPVLAILPGSRSNEINKHGEIFLQTAELCAKKIPHLKILCPLPNLQRAQQMQALLEQSTMSHQVVVFVDQSDLVLSAADAALVASGTATLQAMLHGCLIVVGYRLSNLSYWILKRLVKIPFVGLPNILFHQMNINPQKPEKTEFLVPEFLQEKLQAAPMAAQLIDMLQHRHKYQHALKEFQKIHQQLSADAYQTSAQVILQHITQLQYATLRQIERI